MRLEREHYLGDGLYASFDGFQFILRAPRLEGDHYVALEPKVLLAFLEYAERVKDEIKEQLKLAREANEQRMQN